MLAASEQTDILHIFDYQAKYQLDVVTVTEADGSLTYTDTKVDLKSTQVTLLGNPLKLISLGGKSFLVLYKEVHPS